MSNCCDPSGYRRLFDEGEADRNLRRYDAKGLNKMARRLADYLVSRGMEGRSVIDVGGGVGAFHVELLEAGAASAVNVEISDGYEQAAARLLAREGLTHRVDRRIGDFTDLAGDLESDDVVMNRVICCYPDMERLLGAALASSRRFVAATFPRRNPFSRIGVTIGNAWCRLIGTGFQAYVHPPEAIAATAARAGFEIVFRDRDLVWHGCVFEKAA